MIITGVLRATGDSNVFEGLGDGARIGKRETGVSRKRE